MRRALIRTLLYAAALGLAAQAVLPLLWMLSTSLKPAREVFATPPAFVPAAPTLENFVRLVRDTAFLTYFWNSVAVAGLTVLLTMAVGALGAYSLTRFAFPGRELVAKLILCTYMFAPIMIVIPVYILARRLGIVNTHTASSCHMRRSACRSRYGSCARSSCRSRSSWRRRHTSTAPAAGAPCSTSCSRSRYRA